MFPNQFTVQGYHQECPLYTKDNLIFHFSHQIHHWWDMLCIPTNHNLKLAQGYILSLDESMQYHQPVQYQHPVTPTQMRSVHVCSKCSCTITRTHQHHAPFCSSSSNCQHYTTSISNITSHNNASNRPRNNKTPIKVMPRKT